MTAHLRGHPIHRGADGAFYFTDTGEPTESTWRGRACGHCGLAGLDPDPCLGSLPGVRNACCGHGEPEGAYIIFQSGVTVRGFTVTSPDRRSDT